MIMLAFFTTSLLLLAGGGGKDAAVELASPAVHPLVRIGAVLSDLDVVYVARVGSTRLIDNTVLGEDTLP